MFSSHCYSGYCSHLSQSVWKAYFILIPLADYSLLPVEIFRLKSLLDSEKLDNTILDIRIFLYLKTLKDNRCCAWLFLNILSNSFKRMSPITSFKSKDTYLTNYLCSDNKIEFMGFFHCKNESKPKVTLKFTYSQDFLGSPVVKALCSQCRGPGFDPWSGN